MRILPLSASCLLILGSAVADAGRPAHTVETVLAGRTAGQPQSCISEPMIDSTETFDSGSILYRMKGGPDYLNTPTPQCSALREDRGFVSSTPSTLICRGDILQITDFVSHMSYGACALNDFVPYPRVKKPQ